jgi:hypothetical protein
MFAIVKPQIFFFPHVTLCEELWFMNSLLQGFCLINLLSIKFTGGPLREAGPVFQKGRA